MEQGETIRDYLKRRDRWIRGWRIAGWVLMLVLFALVFWDRTEQHRSVRIGAFIVFCVALGAQGYLRTSTRCPRCGFDLRSKPATVNWLEVSKDRCPSCGVSLDESLKLG
jgi:ribosomal protein S27AE